jgi:hypothetical protein
MRLIILFLIGGSTLLFSLLDIKKDDKDEINDVHQYMMDQLHQGNYDSIPAILDKLYKAHKKEPESSVLNADLGFVYLWRFSERGRKPSVPGIENSVYLSNYYFKEAIRYDPDDARLKGFQAGTEICEGALKKDVTKIYKGYVNAFAAIKEWPQFNKFALSYVSSQLNRNSFLFKLAIQYQWELLDECSCKEIGKHAVMNSPDKIFKELVEELKVSNDPQIKRACWNSEIAPHNYEGFLFNFGDMLVKEGNVKAAKQIYTAARLSPVYKDWEFKHQLEERIREIDLNRYAFMKRPSVTETNDRQIFINSVFSCVGCHQMSKQEYSKSKAISNVSN